MGMAEKKSELMRIVETADEKLAGLIIALANEYNNDYQFTEEDMAKFKESREDYLKSPEKAYSLEESMEQIRSRFKK